jgi:hypothetical protein
MFEYYYNRVPNQGLCRNNLVYTSTIDRSNNLFCVHYTVDQVYHNNECLNEHALKEKWKRELKFYTKFSNAFPQHTLQIHEIDDYNQKIIFKIQDNDFWELSECNQDNYKKILPDWQEQMLEILTAYRRCGIWKYSLHPSSYFVVDGKLKSINHFFCFSNNDPEISILEVLNIISNNRKQKLFDYMQANSIDSNQKFPFNFYGQIALDSFQSNYPSEFINHAKRIYI